MKVLAVGATGKFAGLVVPELIKRGATVRALVHDDSKSEEARRQGAAETAVGNLEDPASLASAVSGVDGIFHIGPGFAPHEAEMGINLVKAAKNAGVRKFVFSGVIHPSLPLTNHQAKQPVEQALYESGLAFTILQPAMFMQNLAGSWKTIVETGRFALPYSVATRACYVDYRDVAETAALALTTDRLDFGTFELSAPGMISRVDLAALISEALGRKIEAANLPFESWAEQAHIPAGPLREGFKRMYADYDQFGFPGGNALVLTAILGREPRTMQQYLQELASQQPQP